MSKVPSLSYVKIVRALQRNGWLVVRQRGSHIRPQKRVGNELLKITVPAHRPVKAVYAGSYFETGSTRPGRVFEVAMTH